MRSSGLSVVLGFVVGLAAILPATAQGPTPAPKGVGSPLAAAKPDLALLKGTWVRLEGGYIIAIKSVGPGGELEAMYFNPNPLPFAKAQANRERRDGARVLRAARGRLRGVDLRPDL